MFLENHTKKLPQGGWIEVICGSMFSGKTEELIRRLRRAVIAGQKVEIFKPLVDSRYHKENIVSHDSNVIKSSPVKDAASILNLIEGVEVVGVDEAQFFDDNLSLVCTQMANNGLRVIVAGLDMDFQGNPFGPIPAMIARAEYVTKVHAICVRCGQLANFSHRKTAEKDLVVLGETENYEPLCRKCYYAANDKGPKS